MHSVRYGSTNIDFSIEVNEELKSHYISVQEYIGVVLRGKTITEDKAKELIIKKARWIIEKLALVESIDEDNIVSGSRMQYLGRKYYVQIIIDNSLDAININFLESKFIVYTSDKLNNSDSLKKAFHEYLQHKAEEKLMPRFKKWQKITGYNANDFRIKKMHKQWGNCSPKNKIIINSDAIKLPYSLIDYIIVHELVHTEIKNHSKEFWAKVAQHIPKWKELDGKIEIMRL
jgi:predicted metal-dependent hydrolase